MLLLSIMTISAQNYVWNFGQDRILFPKGVQYINDTIVAGLTISSKAETNPMQSSKSMGVRKVEFHLPTSIVSAPTALATINQKIAMKHLAK